jgi:hypothetical protein
MRSRASLRAEGPLGKQSDDEQRAFDPGATLY